MAALGKCLVVCLALNPGLSAPDPTIDEFTTFYTLLERMVMGEMNLPSSQFLDYVTVVNLNRTKSFFLKI